MPGDSTPTRNSANLFLCCWDDLLGQKLQIVVRTTSAWFGILKADGLFRGLVPVQIADCHQSKRRAANGLCSFKCLLILVGEGFETAGILQFILAARAIIR